MILLLDNFDSFTYTLRDYFLQGGAEVQVIRNNVPPSSLSLELFTGLVVSPGPETPSKSGYLMEYLDYFWDKTPVLGVCLGQQAIGEKCGNPLGRSKYPRHGKVSQVHIDPESPLFEGLPKKIKVVQYNSLILEEAHGLKIISKNNKDEIMSVAHLSLPIYGIQFHPEAHLTEFGIEMIQNWLKLIK